ncbi:MAG: lipoprotein signal peptidase [Prevotellaceae bacterium]|jgi:signal peptidase II|nr:lipoprotein signal peptidase [Prevotellaceae bacterium]
MLKFFKKYLMSNTAKATLLVLLILLADQALKIWIKTHLTLGEEISILGKRGFIYFTENNGMAFGMEFFGNAGKFLLSIFRIIFIGVIGWYTWKQIRAKAPLGLVLGLAAMFAGALGNLIDCLFYGLIFGESTYMQVAQMFPADGGYAPFLFGKVVDMFYFPIINITLPESFPFWSGERFIFFRPIFNVADAAITLSVFYMLIFQRHIFSEKKAEESCERSVKI